MPAAAQVSAETPRRPAIAPILFLHEDRTDDNRTSLVNGCWRSLPNISQPSISGIIMSSTIGRAAPQLPCEDVVGVLLRYQTIACAGHVALKKTEYIRVIVNHKYRHPVLPRGA